MAGSLIAGSDIRGYLRRVTAVREISAKSNEIPAFAPLLADIDDEHLRGAVVTMDALHAQRDHAAYLVEQRHAHYLVTVKGNQPNLSKHQLRTGHAPAAGRRAHLDPISVLALHGIP